MTKAFIPFIFMIGALKKVKCKDFFYKIFFVFIKFQQSLVYFAQFHYSCVVQIILKSSRQKIELEKRSNNKSTAECQNRLEFEIVAS